MKRLIKTVDLVFFQDDGNGEYGLAHKETYDQSNGTGFNAFWGGMGLFHDVFEHSHEYQNKYFRGDFAMNVGGEMAAMGAMWYYYETLGMYNRLDSNNYRAPSDMMRETTESEIMEVLYSGWCRYGYTLNSNVPKQSPVENSELEYQIEKMWKEVKTAPIKCTDEIERAFAIDYKNSVTFRKIADLHRYGYRMAERLVPDNHDNVTTLIDFFEVWERFCKNHNVEILASIFRGVTFKIYKENDRISWKATFKSADRLQYKNITVTAESIERFYIDDVYLINENYY